MTTPVGPKPVSGPSSADNLVSGVRVLGEVKDSGLFGNTFLKLSVPIKGSKGEKVEVFLDKALAGQLTEISAERVDGKLVVKYEIKDKKSGVLEIEDKTDDKKGKKDITINGDRGGTGIFACAESPAKLSGIKVTSASPGTILALVKGLADKQAAKGSK